jgi:WD40 repeat protein
VTIPAGASVPTESGAGTAATLTTAPADVVLKRQLLTGAEVASLAVSRNGKHLAAGSVGGKLKLWDLAAEADGVALTGHTQEIKTLAFSPDSSLLASGSDDHSVKLWDVRTGKETANLRVSPSSGIRLVAFTPEGTLVSVDKDAVRYWDTARQVVRRQFEPVQKFFDTAALSSDGKILAGIGIPYIRVRTTEPLIVLHDTESGKPRLTPFKHDDMILAVSFSPDGETLATGGSAITGTDSDVSLWEVQTGKKKAKLKGHHPPFGSRGFSFSPDGRFLASAGDDFQAVVWEVATTRKLAGWEAHATKPRMNTGVGAVAFFPDGKTLATGGYGWDNSVKIWDLSALLKPE